MDRIAHLVAAGLLLSSPAVAQTLQAPTQLYNEGDLKLDSPRRSRISRSPM
jgi:hypothetical protein